MTPQQLKQEKQTICRLVEDDVIGPDHTSGWRESWLEQVLGGWLMAEFRRASRGWTCGVSADESVFYSHDVIAWLRGEPNLDD